MTQKVTYFYQELGDALRVLCQFQGWDNKEASAQTGVPRGTLADIFMGRYGPDALCVGKVLAELRVKPKYAIMQANAYQDEIKYIAQFPYIIEKYRVKKQMDKEWLAGQLFPNVTYFVVQYGEMMAGRFEPSIQKVTGMLKNLGMNNIYDLIREAGLKDVEGGIPEIPHGSRVDAELARRGPGRPRSTAIGH